eukprot:gnl/TRDRNA2_/TRDRNA2_176928_c3_seq15.p1 gnl/TRDRNA2_/TRDRNA2_176928_c3~~gnl/TRDRNA2_/TRDRNA2_176928_c3_seq15.p1  ORF type:complete len:323 (+),score=68.26 gnl/TRDRNA2_/TRDRNA2_176928_c3_seq15:56-1024(+)
MGCGGAKQADAGAAKGGDAKKGGKSAVPAKEVGKAGGFSGSLGIIDNPGKITEFYDMDKKKLGEGSYGTVCKATNKTTGVVRACKSISKAQMKNLDRFKQEIAIMKMCDHPNILKLFESFEDHRNIYLILELCSGGELFDRIKARGYYPEEEARKLLANLLNAVAFIHSKLVVHRDLKPENILMVSKSNHTDAKISDFGLAMISESDRQGPPRSTQSCGTDFYLAPEIIRREEYGSEVDMWSCGVVAYVVLCGSLPFFDSSLKKLYRAILTQAPRFSERPWKDVSGDAKDFISSLLQTQPLNRLTAEEALNHHWLSARYDFV